MIKENDVLNNQQAKIILALQKRSYEVEASIIHNCEIPPLQETLLQLQQSKEIFLGYYIEETLAGVISFKVLGKELDIYRLFIDPVHFKKGIAQKLLAFVEMNYSVTKLVVSTASKNIPAIRLYQKEGFVEVRTTKINDELTLVHLEKVIEDGTLPL
ncbi:GNAT family N-acetyltransferase [Priestia flexa]|uniref:GNAT family N-acetyltransferase n=1 Tax=Priestia flexa TaxID=86664 RepID=UPI0039B46E78